MSSTDNNRRRFAVALSFPGEHRPFVRRVARRLAGELGKERVFFDEWYEAELLGVDADLKLRRIYRNGADLIAPFFSTHYEKMWCQIEWHAIRGVLAERRKDDAVVPVHLDDTKVEGWETIDFGIRKGRKSAPQIAADILGAYKSRHTSAAPQLDEIIKSVTSMSAALLNWNTTLASGVWIERLELAELLRAVDNEESSTTVLLGAPGAGKSALLAKLGTQLARGGMAVFAIRADLLDGGVNTSVDLANSLNLPSHPAECIKRLAARGRVVVLIDQLDALGDLLDLRSERLNLLLHLIHDVASVPNVHIICSCRTFEYHHDVRLTSIDASEVVLELPPWLDVSPILASHGLDCEDWPDAFREMLRTPQHLKFFLEHFGAGPVGQAFVSYQHMQDALWERAVNEPDETKLLEDAAEWMAKEESLWLPRARFGGRAAAIDRLVAKGILRLEGNRFGFLHQTLFEHARARAFARTGAGLADYVLARQDSLFIRATCWSTLNYLRDVAPGTYSTEMQRLYGADLRVHLRYLMIDFLGQVTDPTDEEAVWLNVWLATDNLRNKVLSAIRRNPGWFKRLKASHLPVFMREKPEKAWPMVGVLSDAWKFARVDVLSLIEQNWLDDPSKGPLAATTFQSLEEWDERAADDVCRIVGRTDISGHFPMFLASIVADRAPALAPRIAAAFLNARLRELQAQSDPTPEPLPADATLADQIVQRITNDPKQRFAKLLELRESVYDLPAIAQAAPQPFIDDLWPWFVAVVRAAIEEPHHIMYAYRNVMGATGDLDAEDLANRPILASMEAAVREIAKAFPERFLAFLDAWKHEDALIVQRLLCRGLSECTYSFPAAAVGFLTSDPRRLALGGFEDRHQDSRALIAKLVPSLSDDQARVLEHAILDWSSYYPNLEDDPETRRRRRTWDREVRLRLLHSFPFDRMTADTQALVRAEKQALTRYRDRDVKSTGVKFIGSPMSADQMAAASDEQVLGLFNKLTDDTGWDYPGDWGRGGSVQASRELERLVKESPDRGLHLAGLFRPGDQERPAGTIVRALAETSAPSPELFALILELNERGFSSDEYRDDIAQACSIRAERGDGLPASVLNLLAGWLAAPRQISEDQPDNDNGEGEPRSVLWGLGGAYVPPSGTYWILRALAYGYLRRKPAMTDDWLDVHQAHVERPERTAVWQALTQELRFLTQCDAERAASFTARLFDRFPAVRNCQMGVHFLAKMRNFLPSAVYKNLVEPLCGGEWALGSQAYGEVVGLTHLIDTRHEWTRGAVAKILDDGTQTDDAARALTGLAFAAANTWGDAEARPAATDILVRAAEVAGAREGEAVMSVFANAAPLLADEHTRKLLRCLTRRPELLRASTTAFLVEKLEDLVASDRDLVYDVCAAVIEIGRAQITDFQRGVSMAAPHLTNIALTLQRTGGEFRSKGLELFEKLLELGVNDAYALLDELDHRPRNVPKPIRRRRLVQRQNG